ncbi:MAG: hypothetical protein IPK35_23195 [Saprospiraceae bacterium]|nr:hypothetical protein [Saprospiraceae bacterium]
MAAIHDMTIPLLPQRYYHIYNRGIDRNPIFFIDENYRYFLKKYAEKTEGYFNTFAYCLMENHFHFFIQPLSNKEILTKGASDYLFVNQRFLKDFVIPWTARVGIDSSSVKQEDLTNFENLLNLYSLYGDIQSNPDNQPNNLASCDFLDQLCSWILSDRLRGLMLGYAKAINKQQQRTGSLLQKGFRRKNVPDFLYEKKMVLWYIHHNPIHHFYTNHYGGYKWSSYHAFLSTSQTRIKRDIALEWFEDLNAFLKSGDEYKLLKKSHNWMIEEDK